jgi:hypothetical protein
MIAMKDIFNIIRINFKVNVTILRQHMHHIILRNKIKIE